jgi:Protein of unknown function (DUF1207)
MDRSLFLSFTRGSLFEPLIADPRWPHFSVAYQNYLGDQELNNVASVTFGESIALYRNRAPFGGCGKSDFKQGFFRFLTWMVHPLI